MEEMGRFLNFGVVFEIILRRKWSWVELDESKLKEGKL